MFDSRDWWSHGPDLTIKCFEVTALIWSCMVFKGHLLTWDATLHGSKRLPGSGRINEGSSSWTDCRWFEPDQANYFVPSVALALVYLGFSDSRHWDGPFLFTGGSGTYQRSAESLHLPVDFRAGCQVEVHSENHICVYFHPFYWLCQPCVPCSSRYESWNGKHQQQDDGVRWIR